MKKHDYILLSIIALVAITFGYKLSQTLIVDRSHIIVDDITDLETFINQAERPQDGTDIYLTAKQWEWSSEIILDSGRNYRLHIATEDIQHGFYLTKEATGEKIDILLQPRKKYTIVLQNLKQGVYPIGCTQYCGIAHNKMRGKIIVR